MSASVPQRIGKFEIVDRLGQGGMGTVYKARDPALDRLVALKTIVKDAVDSDEAKERFFREARAAARLQHPNIVTVYEAGDFEGTLYIAMELLDGHDLSGAIHAPRSIEDKPLGWFVTRGIGVDLGFKWSVFGSAGAWAFQRVTGLTLYFLLRSTSGMK